MTRPFLVAPAVLIATAFAPLPAMHAASAQQMRHSVMAVLTTKIDTKTAKVGDAVTAQTTEKTTLKDGAKIPRDAKLIGVIIDVTTEKDGNGMSMLRLKFQQIVIKHDPPIAIHGGLLAVAPPPGATGELPLGSTSVPPGGLQSMSDMGYEGDQDKGIPSGSTVGGVGLSTTIDSDGTTELQGNHTEIKLNRGSRLRVALF